MDGFVTNVFKNENEDILQMEFLKLMVSLINFLENS